MKKKLMAEKIFRWLIRDEISVKQRFLNIALASVFMVMIPCIIFTGFIYKNAFSVMLPIAGITAVSVGLWSANNNRNFKIWSLCVSGVICYIILPVCYFWDGGKESSDDIWFMAGLILIFILLEGKAMWIMAVADSIVISVCFFIEYTHPELVHHLGTPESMIFENVLSMIIIGTSLGMIFSFQSYLYEKQAADLLEKERNLKDTMQALEKANNAKSEFVANMSHEIRTPINAVLGMNEMILRESKEDKILEYAYNVDNAGHTLLTLINDVLDFSKIDSGKMAINEQDYEVFALLKNCYNMVIRRAMDKKLEFTILNNPTLPSVLGGDEIRVRQVITNILTNAVKYTAVGSVTMKVDYELIDDDNLNLIVSVVDTGLGIREEDKAAVFAKFERAQAEANRNIEGTGLGLAIASNLIELMGGNISFESKFGLGSTFTVKIPQKIKNHIVVGNLSDRFELNIDNKKEYRESFKAPKAKILSVDDVKINHDVLCNLLKQTEVDIDCVYSGRECLNHLRNKEYDLVLLDVMMPEMDGVETLKRIRKLENSPNTAVPVIAITANALGDACKQYLDLGFDDYISKPLDFENLEKTIISHLPTKLLYNSKDPLDDLVPERVDIVDRLSFLDTVSGIRNCAGSMDIYNRAVMGFAGKDMKADALNDGMKNKDWDKYIINVHNLKNQCNLIGAVDLSKEAVTLEKMVKDGKYEEAKNSHDLFMEHYLELTEKIRGIVFDEQQ